MAQRSWAMFHLTLGGEVKHRHKFPGLLNICRYGLDHCPEIRGQLRVHPGIHGPLKPSAIPLVMRNADERPTLVFAKRPHAAGLVFDDVPGEPLLLLTPPLRQTLGLAPLKRAAALVNDALPLLRVAPKDHRARQR